MFWLCVIGPRDLHAELYQAWESSHVSTSHSLVLSEGMLFRYAARRLVSAILTCVSAAMCASIQLFINESEQIPQIQWWTEVTRMIS